jgi:hypothetical protein
MKTQCDDQTNTNNTILISHPVAEYAYQHLVQSLPSTYNHNQIEKLYEEKYNCKITWHDKFGISGTLTFNRDKDLTWFLLQHSEL